MHSDDRSSDAALGGKASATKGARAAQTLFDVRSVFSAEGRALPLLFIVSGLAAYVSAASWPYAWWWLGAVALAASLRFVIASNHERKRKPIPVDAPAAQAFFGLYAAELLLWGVYFALIPDLGRAIALGAGFAAAGAVMIAALTIGGWPRGWTLYIAGWAAVGALVIARTGAVSPGFALGFPPWLAAAWWFGVHQTRRATAALVGGGPLTLGRPTMLGPARIGWTAAIQAMPTPVIVARKGRIVELNGAASQFIGRREPGLLGAKLEDCVIVDPPEALSVTNASPRGNASAYVLPVSRAFEGESWPARLRFLEPGNPESSVVIVLARPETVGHGTRRFADDAGRLADWIGGLQGQPWYRDEKGALYLPPAYRIGHQGEHEGAPPDDDTFPLLPLVPEDRRASVAATYRAAMRSAHLFDARVPLLDVNGSLREMRVTCLRRPALGDALAPLIGAIAPARTLEKSGGADDAALLQRLPALLWQIDAGGRVVAARGIDPQRWGLLIAASDRPLWSEAFRFDANSRDAVFEALRRALAGSPTFDILIAREGPGGARLMLRSHVVPFTADTGPHAGRRGALVFDTVASPQQLAETERLKRSKAQYKALVEASPNLIWACDAEFKFSFVTRSAARAMYGCEPSDLLGRSIAVLLAPGAGQTHARRMLAALRTGEPLRGVEMEHVGMDGRRVAVTVNAAPLKAVDGSFAGAIGMNADQTALKLRELRLAEALRIERTVLDSAGQAIAVVKEGLVVRCNDAFLHLLRVPPAQLARTPLAEFFVGDEEWSAIVRAADEARTEDRATVCEVQVRRGGRDSPLPATAWCQLTARSIAPGEYVVVIADIDLIRKREEHARHEAHHDDLTGLPNRRLFGERALTALATSALRNSQCAVLAIDLDGFKEVNDRFGHNVGDLVLREISDRIARAMRPQDTVSRRGGDEFAVLIPDITHRTDAERLAVRLLTVIAQPHALPDGNQVGLSASIGIALAPEHGRDPEKLLQLADLAMYQAKLAGKNRYAFAAAAPAASATITPIGSRSARAV